MLSGVLHLIILRCPHSSFMYQNAAFCLRKLISVAVVLLFSFLGAQTSYTYFNICQVKVLYIFILVSLIMLLPLLFRFNWTTYFQDFTDHDVHVYFSEIRYFYNEVPDAVHIFYYLAINNYLESRWIFPEKWHDFFLRIDIFILFP